MLSYAIQWVGYDYEQFDSEGETNLDGFLAAFDSFPWADQHAKWDLTQDGPLPALALRNDADQRELAVTQLGGNASPGYQLFAMSMQSRKSLFGKAKLERQVKSAIAQERVELTLLCQLFCQRRYDEFDREVIRLADVHGED